MNEDAVDYAKMQPDLYSPENTPSLVDVPPMRFIMIDLENDDDYENVASILSAISETINTKGAGMAGYFEYLALPLEELRSDDDGNTYRTLMVRVPEFVTLETFQWAARLSCNADDIERMRFGTFTEGLCVQMMIPSENNIPTSMAELKGFMDENGLIRPVNGKGYHLIRTDPEKGRILRIQVTRRTVG